MRLTCKTLPESVTEIWHFVSIQFEGALVSADVLGQFQSGDVRGQRAGDFNLNGRLRLTWVT